MSIKKYLGENASRFIITNIAFAIISYTLFLSVNSAVPGSVDKVQGAMMITILLIVFLNVSFAATFAVTNIVSKYKLNLFLCMVSDTTFFLILFWALVLLTQ
jgi:hypothetical protein